MFPFCIDQTLPAHGSSLQKKRDSFRWNLVGTIHAHDTSLAPHLAGPREGFTSSSQKPQGWPLQLAGLIQPPSHQALAASDPPLSTLQPALESPNVSLGPSSVYQHPALREQPTQIPCCSLEVDLNLHEAV